MLCHAAEQNQQRDSELRPSRVHLQCLRCGSEFALQGGVGQEDEAGGRTRRRGAAMLPEGAEEREGEQLSEAECGGDGKGESEGESKRNET